MFVDEAQKVPALLDAGQHLYDGDKPRIRQFQSIQPFPAGDDADRLALLDERILLVEGDHPQFAGFALRGSRQHGGLQKAAQFPPAVFGGEPCAALDGLGGRDNVTLPFMRGGGKGRGRSGAAQGKQRSVLQHNPPARRRPPSGR